MTEPEIEALFSRDLDGGDLDDLPTAEDVATLYLDQAEDALATWSPSWGAAQGTEGAPPPEAAEIAVDLLASWAGLRRLRPSALDERAKRTVAELERALGAANGSALAGLARAALAPEGWRRGAEAWRVALVTPGVDTTDPDTAAGLLGELDEAERVVAALAALGSPDADLEASVDACREEAVRSPEMFLPARRYLVALARLVDPAVGERDPELAVTADKFVTLLDAVEEAAALQHVSASFFDATPIVRRVALLERLRVAASRLAGSIRDAVLAPLTLPVHVPLHARAATTAAARGLREEWRALDGSWRAWARLPPTTAADDSSELRLHVVGALPGDRLVLCGLPRSLDFEGDVGHAVYTLGDLRAAAGGDALCPTVAIVRAGGDVSLGARVGADEPRD